MAPSRSFNFSSLEVKPSSDGLLGSVINSKKMIFLMIFDHYLKFLPDKVFSMVMFGLLNNFSFFIFCRSLKIWIFKHFLWIKYRSCLNWLMKKMMINFFNVIFRPEIVCFKSCCFRVSTECYLLSVINFIYILFILCF